MTSSLLATKLHCPPVPPKRVPRPQLIQCLNDGLAAGRTLTLVSAPAGFGKTTCVSEWLNVLAVPVTWLSLDPADDDPGRFFTYLVAALHKVDEHLGREIEGVLRAGQLPAGEFISTTLINDILEVPDRFLLVLDDFQVIQAPLILQVLEKLVDRQLQPLHLVLLTREDPAFPLARLRANNQLTEIRAGDLRFTSCEADRFLNEVMGLSLSQADIAVLADRTEGWVVGLQLAGLSVRDRADPSSFIATLSGNHRYILSYLTEEVLSRQPEDVQHFLLQTSILNRLSGEVCDAVTGRTDSGALLAKLFAANLFLIPLDDEGQWYRYHHLFADLLVNRLRQTLPVQVIHGLHSLASEWLAWNDYLDEAVQHALAGKDHATAAALVERAARAMMFTGRVNLLKNWLAGLPETSFHTHPRLRIYRVWIDLLQGEADLSERVLYEKENLLRALPPSPENDQLRVELMLVLCRFVALSGNTARAIRLAQEALTSLPEEDLASRARAHSALAIAYGLEGNLEQAERAYRECLHLSQAAGYYSLAAHTTMIVALGLSDYGRLHEAARSFQSIIDMGVPSGQQVFYPAGQGYIGLAGIHLEWNDLETAEDYLKRGMALCQQGGLAGISTGRLIQSRLRQAKGDLEGALEEIWLLAQTAQSTDGLTPLTTTARQIQIRLALGDSDGVARWAAPLMNKPGGDPAMARPPLVVLEAVQALIARILLARGEVESAMQSLAALQATAEPGKRFGRLIEVHLLRALALQKQHKGDVTSAALDCFEQALDVAEPQGYVRLFVEEGPAVLPLLNAVANRPTAPDRLKAYARKLQAAFAGAQRAASPVTEAARSPDHPLVDRGEGMLEPLSKREIEVLRLMAQGLTYREIAQRLVLSLNTVRFHVKGLYGKLDVGKRAAAVDRARVLGLL